MFLLLLSLPVHQKECRCASPLRQVKVKSLLHLWIALAHWLQQRENQKQYSYSGLQEMQFNLFNRLGGTLLRSLIPSSQLIQGICPSWHVCMFWELHKAFQCFFEILGQGLHWQKVLNFWRSPKPSPDGSNFLMSFCYNTFQIS